MTVNRFEYNADGSYAYPQIPARSKNKSKRKAQKQARRKNR